MKSLLVRLGVILIGLIIFGYAEVWGADWKFYSATELFLNYYDAQSITLPYKNVFRVWIKSDATKKGVLECVGSIGKQCENFSHLLFFMEINCLEKTSRRLSLTYYDNRGGVIYSTSSPSEWAFIIPESMGEGLYKVLCK